MREREREREFKGRGYSRAGIYIHPHTFTSRCAKECILNTSIHIFRVPIVCAIGRMGSSKNSEASGLQEVIMIHGSYHANFGYATRTRGCGLT